jgi:hypothetical protein
MALGNDSSADDVFVWVNDPSLVSYCLTWVRGLTPSGVFGRWQAE